jgi:hypothetical protein
MSGKKSEVQPRAALADVERQFREALHQVELIGEIPLEADTCAQLGKTVSLFVKAAGHRGALRMLKREYPCLLAVYLVSQGVYGYEGGDYWSEVVQTTGFSSRYTSQVGKTFESIVEDLGLPMFYDMRVEANRYVSLILAHGGIPNYCLPDFFANMLQPSILRAEYADMSAAELIDEWRWQSSTRYFTDKPVIRFLIHGGRVAEDFVDRCREMARTYLDEGLMPDPDEVGLPRRVVEAYDEWIAKQDAKQVEREETDRWGLRKPRVLVDPWGEGVVLDLPPQQVPATELYTDIAWQVTTDDRTDRVPVHVRRVGFDRKTETEVFALSQPVEKVEVSLQVDGESKRMWRYQGVDEAHPMLVFDPEQGTLVSWTLSLPASPLGLLYPAGTELSVEGEGRLVEELPRLPWGWSGFRGEIRDLTNASHLTLVRDGEEIASISLQPDEASKRPFLVGGELFSPQEGEDRAPIYVGSPPRIRVPLAGRGSLDEELVRWRFNLQNKWSALPEIHKTTTLAELKPHLLVSEKHVDLPLSLPSLLGETPYGNFSVRMRGPLGRDAGFTLRMVPHLVVCGHQQLHLPDPQTGPSPATLLVETLARSRVECRAEDTAQTVRTTERGEITWHHEVDVEPDVTEVDLAVVRPRPSAEDVRVPVRLPIRRLRWALVDEETATRRGVWTGEPIKRPIDALLQLQSPFLLIKLPLSDEDNIKMGLRMVDVEGAELQVMDWDLLSHSRQLWRFDLSAFLDTVRASRSPVLRFELAIWGLPERSEPLRLPVLSLTQTLLVEDAELSARTADEQVFFDLTWREPVRLRSRRVRFWPLWRPWDPVFEQPIPDEAEGSLSFEVEPDKLRSGKYRLEFLVVDPWAPTVETPHCPVPDAPSTVDVQLISARRQLDALQTRLRRQGPRFETLLERAAIYHDIGEPERASSDLQWCYEHLDDGTVPQMLTLDDLVRAAGDKVLTRSLHLKLFAARRVERLLAAHEAGDVSEDDFKSYLGKLPRSGLLPESTCQLLLSVQGETVRLRAVQQLIRRENELGPRAVLRWVEDAEISDSDAAALLGLNPEFSADVLKADLNNPIVSRLLESLAPQLGDKTPIVQPGTWVRTDAGWGRIDRIEDQDGEPVDQFLSGRTGYRLHVTLRPAVDAEPVVVDLARKLIRFPQADVIYTCTKCKGFSTQDCYLIVERHDYVAHGGIGPGYRKERVTFRSLRNLTYRARPPAKRGLGI